MNDAALDARATMFWSGSEIGTPDGFSDGGIVTSAAKAKNNGCN